MSRTDPGDADVLGTGLFDDASAMLREILVERWTTLTRDVLPGMASAQRWPIRFDHCFMRVCLDAAVGVRWDTVVRRPAVRHLSLSQLAAAVDHAERIAAEPALLPTLNRASLRLRGRA